MTEQTHPAEPLAVRPAATVMLVRDTGVDCLEVFLMRRHAAMEFAAESIRKFHQDQMPEEMWLHEIRSGVFAGDRTRVENVEFSGAAPCAAHLCNVGQRGIVANIKKNFSLTQVS